MFDEDALRSVQIVGRRAWTSDLRLERSALPPELQHALLRGSRGVCGGRGCPIRSV
jgi:hypothetical protein